MFPSRRLIAYGSLVIGAVFLLSWFSPTDADTFWHLRTGRFILEAGFPRVDPFSFVLEGRRWIAFEWLAQIFFWIALRAGGAPGLVAFKAAICAGAFLAVFLCARRSPAIAAALAIGAAFGARGFFVERPFIFDYLFFGAWLLVLWEKDFSRPASRRDWLLPVSVVLWSNLHGGAALLGPFLLGAALAVERPHWRTWGPVLAASLSAVVVHPAGWGVVEQFWATLAFPAKDLLYEWRRPTTEWAGVFGAFFAAAVFSLPALWKRRPRAAVWTGAPALAALGIQRNIPFLLLVAVPASAAAAESWTTGRKPRRDAVVWAALLLAAAVGFRLHTERVYPQRRLVALPEIEVPFEGASAFLERERIAGRGFNEYEAGGALIYRTAPERKVFIDGRSLEYGSALLADALRWFQPDRWRALDRRWNFNYAVLARSRSGAYTARVLDASPDWALAYWDDEAMVYLKENERNASILKRLRYSLLQPGRSNHQYIGSVLRAPGGAERLLAELDRTLAEAPSCANARQIKIFVLASLNRIGPATKAAEAAVAAHPDRAQAHFLKGWVHETAGDPRAAEKAYREALDRIDRRTRSTLGADILNNLGRLRETAGDREGALGLYRRALEWNPRQGHASRNLKRLGG